jgi:hypothetical protein
MPNKYLAEMLCDIIAASRAYCGKTWTFDRLKFWYQTNRDEMFLHINTDYYVQKVMRSNNEKEYTARTTR